MAKIVYGVSGEGSGHSSRAREMIAHLEQLGHAVKVASYDRGYANLKDDFDVFETEGLHIASSDNRVSKVKTFTQNLQRLPQGHKKLHALRKNIFKQIPPLPTEPEQFLNEPIALLYRFVPRFMPVKFQSAYITSITSWAISFTSMS